MNRRGFLKACGIGAAAVVTSAIYVAPKTVQWHELRLTSATTIMTSSGYQKNVECGLWDCVPFSPEHVKNMDENIRKRGIK